MISNERRFPSSNDYNGGGNPKAPFSDTLLKSEKLQVERKTFTLVVKENSRGRLLRITEGAGRQRNNIIIPASGLEEFRRVFDEMTRAAGENPT